MKLVDDGIIDTPQAPKKVEPPQPAGKSGGRGTKRPATIGFRSRGWKPPPSTKPPAKTPAKVTPAKLKPPSGKPKAPAAPGVAKRWAKKLASSDAQKVKAGTKRTGKLRLTKSVFNIDHIQYFRYDLFAPQSWQAEVRSGGKTYEVAMVDFDVTFSGRSLGTRTLMIDFALHRVAKQKNVPTILAWGYGLAVELAKKDRTGDWVVIELLSDGSYRLVIQAARPAWA